MIIVEKKVKGFSNKNKNFNVPIEDLFIVHEAKLQAKDSVKRKLPLLDQIIFTCFTFPSSKFQKFVAQGYGQVLIEILYQKEIYTLYMYILYCMLT